MYVTLPTAPHSSSVIPFHEAAGCGGLLLLLLLAVPPSWFNGSRAMIVVYIRASRSRRYNRVTVPEHQDTSTPVREVHLYRVLVLVYTTTAACLLCLNYYCMYSCRDCCGYDMHRKPVWWVYSHAVSKQSNSKKLLSKVKSPARQACCCSQSQEQPQ